MKLWMVVIVFCAGLAGVMASAEQVSLVGRPSVSRVMTFSPVYLGGDLQLAQRVLVRNDLGQPVSGVTVRLFARARNGVLMRLRSYGVTDNAGLATVTGLFELDNDSRVTLQACLVDSEDVCSPSCDYNLLRRTDLEMSFSYNKNTQIGNIGYTENGKPVSGVYGVAQSTYDFSSRANFSVFDHRSHSGKESALNLYAGYSYGANVGDSLLAPRLSSETLTPGGFVSGGSFVTASRFVLDGSIASGSGSEGGYRHAEAMFVQPMNDRWRGLAGYVLHVPEPPRGTVLGASQGPRAGLELIPKSGAQTFRLFMGWVKTNRSSFPDTSGPGSIVNLSSMSSPEATFDWGFHHGGPLWGDFTFSAGNFGTPVPTYYSMGMTITLRNFLRRLP